MGKISMTDSYRNSSRCICKVGIPSLWDTLMHELDTQVNSH